MNELSWLKTVFCIAIKDLVDKQLNHSVIGINVKRPHACTWFGVCSYRKLKAKVEKRKSLCPICSEELVKLHYFGDRHIVKNKDESGFVGCFVDNLVDSDGSVNWVEAHSGSYRN